MDARKRIEQYARVMRNHPTVESAAAALGMTRRGLSSLFSRCGLIASDYVGAVVPTPDWTPPAPVKQPASAPTAPSPIHRSAMAKQQPVMDAEIPIEWDGPVMPTRDADDCESVQPLRSRASETPSAGGAASDDDAQIARLVAITRKKETTIDVVCDTLDVSPKRLRSLVEKAKASGYLIDFAGNLVGVRPHEPSAEAKTVTVSATGPTHRFAVASDIHVGSKWFLKDQFVDFVNRAYTKGVRNILLPGDNLDGCYKHSRWEETHHGFHDQASHFFDVLPQLDGLRYDGIIGNHCETFEHESGLSVVHSMNDMAKARGRNDFQLHGARGAYIHLAAKDDRRGVFVELWHPRSGNSYALTYHLQKHVEKYAPGGKPDFLFAGHWHTSVYCTIRGVHSFASGTFHGGGGSFSKSLGGVQSIGGWIVEYALTEGGTVREVKPEWVAYYEREEVRDVALG